MKKGVIRGIVLLAVMMSTAAFGQQKFLRIGSGLAGTYPLYGARLAELLNKNMPDVRATTVPGGTEQNLVRVQRGELEASLSYTFEAAEVAAGKGELKVPTPDLRHVMSTYGSYVHVTVRKDSTLKSLADVKNRPTRVWLGSKASVLWTLGEAALAAHGVKVEDITRAGGVINTVSYQNLTQAFQDGQVEVAFFAGPSPFSLLMQIDKTAGFRILPFDDEAGRKFNEILPGTGMVTLKGGLYQSQPQDVRLPYVYNQVVASAKLPDELVYRMTKLMNEQSAFFHGVFPGSNDIQPKNALLYNRLPLHPGAERYYRESGALK